MKNLDKENEFSLPAKDVPLLIFSRIICYFRSIYYSSKIDHGGGKIILTSPFIRLTIQKHKTSDLTVFGIVKLIQPVGNYSSVTISMAMNSRFDINGDFAVGSGVTFILASNSTLSIGGNDKKSISEMSADSMVLVYNKIQIGSHFLCASNIMITDSDCQEQTGEKHPSDVLIGNNVHIEKTNSILKGTTIGKNCVLASYSKLTNATFPDNVRIGGNPPKILKTIKSRIE